MHTLFMPRRTSRPAVPIHHRSRGPRYLCALLTLVAIGRSAHAAPTPVAAPIKAVTVYPDQARISRTSTITLGGGEQSVLIEKLPLTLNPASLRASVKGKGRISILRLSHQEKQESTSPFEKIASLQHQIDSLSGPDRQMLQDHLESFTKQKELLVQIAQSGGQQMAQQVYEGTVNVTQWEAAYNFIGHKLTQVNDSIRLVTLRLTEIDQKTQRLQQERDRVASYRGQSSITVQIDLRIQERGEVSVTLEYMIGGASWTPMYDARLSAPANDVELTAFGEVTQHTGEDWKDVELSLSTAQPSSGTSPKALAPWNVQVYAQTDSKRKYETASMSLGTAREVTHGTTQNVDDLLSQGAGVQTNPGGQVFIRGGYAGEVSYIVDGVPINDNLGGSVESLSSIEGMSLLSDGTIFKAINNETINSGGEAVRAPIGMWTLNAETRLMARPKSREGVFRQVTITNQSEAPLLPGKVAIFAESDFLGYETINGFVAPRQSFQLGFGMDNRVSAKREILSFSRSSHGNTSSIDQTVRLTLDNHSIDERLLVLEEQLPVSRDGRIKIKSDQIQPRPDSTSIQGIAYWTLKLSAGKKQEITVPYRIEYPTGVQVLGLVN